MEKSFKKISGKVARLEKKPYFPENVANLPDSVPDIDQLKIVFSFSRYFSNHCELSKYEGKDFTKLMDTLKHISSIEARHFRHRQISGITCKPVTNAGNYRKLYSILPEDEDLFEIVLGGTERIFGFIIKNTFNVVLFKKLHIKYD